ncbi:hypothetical protein B5F40_12035 [Gordonibacter sp. An230]|nr:hypothetical protein B5F40_12035 [Gordonibacter sp. An230]
MLASERFDLTQREPDVAFLLVKGCALGHDAEALRIFVGTAPTCSKSSCRKLGMRRKRDLAAMVEQAWPF